MKNSAISLNDYANERASVVLFYAGNGTPSGSYHPLGHTDELIASAREWLCDCFPHDEDEIAECTEAQIVRAVNRYRDGGWADFVACHQ